MRVLVTSFVAIADVRYLDCETGVLQNADGFTWEDADGCFYEQDGSLFSFFRREKEIHLYLDGKSTIMNQDLETQMEVEGEMRRFQAFRNEKLFYQKRYPKKPETDGNPFWPSDAEDEDILLMIHNLVQSKERQALYLNAKKKD